MWHQHSAVPFSLNARLSIESGGFGHFDLTLVQGLVPGKLGYLILWDVGKYLQVKWHPDTNFDSDERFVSSS